MNNIIDVTGASQYHGFLPVLVRNCITTLIKQKKLQEADEEENEDEKNMREFDDAAKVMEYVSDISIRAQLSIESKFPLPLATALFSFLYHLASYEAGGEALVSCGMMESLLQVINWHGMELEHITVRNELLLINLSLFMFFLFAVCNSCRASYRSYNQHRYAIVPSTWGTAEFHQSS